MQFRHNFGRYLLPLLRWLQQHRISLKGALLLVLLPGLILVLNADRSYNKKTLLKATQQAYDRGLLALLRTLEHSVIANTPDQPNTTNLEVHVPYSAIENLESATKTLIFYSVEIVNANTPRLIAGTALPHPLAHPLPTVAINTPLFYTADYASKKNQLRIALIKKPLYGASGESYLLLKIAETTETRNLASTALNHRSIWHDIVSSGIAMLLLFLAVYWAFKPLQRLHDEVVQRKTDDTTPLDPSKVPEEVRALVFAINHHVHQQTLATAAQSRFLADAAHQLRTPLAILQTQAEYALREPKIDYVRESLQAMVQQLTHASRLTSQLLSLSRASHQTLSESIEIFNLADCAQSAMLDILPLAHSKQQDLGWEDDGSALWICANPHFVREAISNLISNAITYTQAGGHITVRATLAWKSSTDKNLKLEPWARIWVEDNGPGIAAHLRERMFERFQRNPDQQAQHPHGSGLGLAITREFTLRYGGEIWLQASTSGGVAVCMGFSLVTLKGV